ncbi:MAG: tol-pal system protein YbgF [Notoacmeibacter sp.]|nr:tol-pal system protein YbgF [Notoacmeibacter sp.]MCC0031571.1 tol-pal system protein YbgF [Brucellaceae bacterium]
MRSRYAFFLLAALPFAAMTPAHALDGAGLVPLPKAERAEGKPMLLAQSFDPRVTQLEEQVRKLNGQIEELNFQILQMQEALRKAQEDNEFRLQQLEEKKSDAGDKVPGKPDEDNQTVAEQGAPMDDHAQSPSIVTAGQEPAVPEVDWSKAADSAKLGKPAGDLGSLKVDKDGNVIGADESGIDNASGDEPADKPETAPPDGTTVAALPSGEDAGSVYSNSYQFVLSGDYKTAEAGFRDYIERFPDGEQVADATFWLGESLLGQERYRDAAEVFLEGGKAHPASAKAPDMMLKLGISLAAMKQGDMACATYGAIPKKFPKLGEAMRERVRQEQKLAGC